MNIKIKNKIKKWTSINFFRETNDFRLNKKTKPIFFDKIKKNKKSFDNIDKIKKIALGGLLKNKKDELLWIILAYAYFIEKNYEKSIKCIYKSIESDPVNLDNWMELSKLYKIKGDISSHNFISSNMVSLASAYYENPFQINEKGVVELMNTVFFKLTLNKTKDKKVKMIRLDKDYISKNISTNAKKTLLFINPPVDEPFLFFESEQVHELFYKNKSENYSVYKDRLYLRKQYSYNMPLGLLRIAKKKSSEGNNVFFLDCLSGLPSKYLSSEKRVTPSDLKGKKLCKGISVKYFHLGLTYKEIETIIKRQKYVDEIWIGGTFTYNNESVKKIIKICKKVLPKTKIVLGGIYPTLANEDAKKSKADIVFFGDYPKVTNLKIDYKILGYAPDYMVIKGTKGCPYNCAYCAVHVLEGNKFTHRKPDEVFEEIYQNNKKFGINKVVLWDSNLLTNYDKYFGLVLKKIIKSKIKLEIEAPEGLDYRRINKKVAKDLKLAGFKKIRLALENFDCSFSKKELNRSNDIKKIKRAIYFLKKNGFEKNISIFVISGLPKQSAMNMQKNIEFIFSLGCKAIVFPFTPIPQTEIYKKNEKMLKMKKLSELHPFFHVFVVKKDMKKFCNFIKINSFNDFNLDQKSIKKYTNKSHATATACIMA